MSEYSEGSSSTEGRLRLEHDLRALKDARRQAGALAGSDDTDNTDNKAVTRRDDPRAGAQPGDGGKVGADKAPGKVGCVGRQGAARQQGSSEDAADRQGDVRRWEASLPQGPGDGHLVAPIPRIIAASAGHEHSLFLDTHGRVYACGNGRESNLI